MHRKALCRLGRRVSTCLGMFRLTPQGPEAKDSRDCVASEDGRNQISDIGRPPDSVCEFERIEGSWSPTVFGEVPNRRLGGRMQSKMLRKNLCMLISVRGCRFHPTVVHEETTAGLGVLPGTCPKQAASVSPQCAHIHICATLSHKRSDDFASAALLCALYYMFSFPHTQLYCPF